MIGTGGMIGSGAGIGTIGTAIMIATETTGTTRTTANTDTASMTPALAHPANPTDTNMIGIAKTTDAETPDAPPIRGAATITLTLADIDSHILSE
jgi:hypothetical protein